MVVELALMGAVVAVRGEGPPAFRYVLWAAFSGLGTCAGLGGLYRGLAVGSMGVVAPITAVAPVVPLVVGFARGERPGALQTAGMIVALAGAVLVSRDPRAKRERGRVA